MSSVSRKRKAPSYRRRVPYRKRPKRTMGLAPMRTGGYWPARPGPERKAVDVDTASYTVINTATATLLNGVAAGTDFTDRIGRNIRLKSVYIRGVLVPEDNTITNQLVRMILVYDRQPNAAALTITDILKAADVTAQLNLNNRDRFKIVCDKQWALALVDTTATQAVAGSPTIHPIKIYKKLNLQTQYSGTTNAIGSIATGSFYMVLIGTNNAGTGAIMRISIRTRFVDF